MPSCVWSLWIWGSWQSHPLHPHLPGLLFVLHSTCPQRQAQTCCRKVCRRRAGLPLVLPFPPRRTQTHPRTPLCSQGAESQTVTSHSECEQSSPLTPHTEGNTTTGTWGRLGTKGMLQSRDAQSHQQPTARTRVVWCGLGSVPRVPQTPAPGAPWRHPLLPPSQPFQRGPLHHRLTRA